MEPSEERMGPVNARDIGQNLSSHWLLLAIVPLLAMLLQGCPSPDDESCTAGLSNYMGKCMTPMAIVYAGCTEDRGISTTTKVSGGVAGTMRLVTNASVNVSVEETRQEDRAVALQKIKDCLEIAKQKSPSNDPERPVVTQLIREWRTKETLVYEVPDVRGQTGEAAKKFLEANGFEVEPVYQASDDVEKDNAIGTDPAGGEPSEKGSTVELFISTGPDQVSPTQELIEVPSVVGLPGADAENELNNAGFAVQANEVETTDAPPSVVLNQEPEAGTLADPGSTVTITVVVEPEPSSS
jgi:hypothetical protein